MEIQDLIARFSDTDANRQKAIFSSLFIFANRLQTLFDARIPGMTLRQFMLLSVVRQAGGGMSLTQLAVLLGCSRQNVKKLARPLADKQMVRLFSDPRDSRVVCLETTRLADDWFRQDFAAYQKELEALFSVYTPEQLQTLFDLFMRLQEGIALLEQLPANAEGGKSS